MDALQCRSFHRHRWVTRSARDRKPASSGLSASPTGRQWSLSTPCERRDTTRLPSKPCTPNSTGRAQALPPGGSDELPVNDKRVNPKRSREGTGNRNAKRMEASLPNAAHKRRKDGTVLKVLVLPEALTHGEPKGSLFCFHARSASRSHKVKVKRTICRGLRGRALCVH